MLYATPRPVVMEVTREGVNRALDDGVALIAIVAEKGLGKTTAVAGWARGVESEGVWVSVREELSQRTAFWDHVFGLAEDATTTADAPIAGPAVDGSDVRRSVVRWALSVTRPFVLVVDGIDHLEDQAVADLGAVSDLSTGIRIVVISRQAVSLPPHTPTVGGEDLVFSEEETVEILRKAAHRTYPEGVARTIHREASGYPPVVSAVARDLMRWSVGGAVPPGAIARLVAENVERLLVAPLGGVLVSDLPMLRRIALLEHASVDEACEVTGAPADVVRAALDAAVQASLGHWRTEADASDALAARPGPRFVFSPAVARALAAPLRGNPVHSAALRLAATIRGSRGEVFDAITLAIDGRDFRAAVALGSGSLVELITDHTDALLAQLSAIPMSELSKDPLVVLFLAVLHAQRPRGRLAMLALFAKADRLAGAGGGAKRPADRAVLLAVRSVALRLLGRSDWAASTARSAVESLDAASPHDAENLGLLRSLVLGQSALALFWSGDLAGARTLAVRTATTDGAPERARQHAWAKSTYIEAVWGDIVSARDHSKAAHALDRWPAEFFRVPGEVADALIAAESLDNTTAVALLDGLGRRTATTEFWPVAVVVRAYLLVADRQAGDAVRVLSAALEDRSAAPVSGRARHIVVEALALAHLANGERALARAALRQTGGRQRASVVSVLLMLASDEPDAAIAAVGEGLRTHDPSPRLEASFRLLRAAAANRQGYRIGAARDVSIVLDILASSGLRTPWALIPARDREGIERIAVETLGPDSTLVGELAAMPLLVPDVPSRPSLTARERQVMIAVAAGRSNAEIASFLGVSINTVRKQRAGAYRKLGASTRDEALAIALERGVLDAADDDPRE